MGSAGSRSAGSAGRSAETGGLEERAESRSFSASPSQISNITDKLSSASSNSVIVAADDIDEAESNYPIIPLLMENSSHLYGLPEFPATPMVEPVGATTEENVKEVSTSIKEVSTSIVAGSFIEENVEGGGSVEKILTELLEVAAQPEAQIIMEKCPEKDEGVRNLEVALTRFSTAMDKLYEAIREVLLPAIEQWKPRSGSHSVFFFLARLGEMTLAFFLGAMLVFVLLTSAAPNLSEFKGPAPT